MFNKFKPSKVQSDMPEHDVPEEAGTQSIEAVTKLPSKILNSTQKPSIISEGASFEGNLTFDGALHLDGKFKGNIKVDKITVGKNGMLDGKFEANTVIAFGEIKGEVTCGELVLNEGSRVEGQIQYANLKIHSGASISGEIHCKKI